MDEVKTRTGPLTELQRSMLTDLMEGMSHAQVGEKHGKSKTHTSNIISAAVAKMGCRKTTAAVSMMATRAAYLEAAELIQDSIEASPVNAAEMAVNRVLEGLVAILRTRAAALLPT